MPLAKDLTDGKFEHWNPNDSFSKLLLDEVAAVDVFSDVLSDFMIHFAQKHGIIDPIRDEQNLESGRMIARFIHRAFK